MEATRPRRSVRGEARPRARRGRPALLPALGLAVALLATSSQLPTSASTVGWREDGTDAAGLDLPATALAMVKADLADVTPVAAPLIDRLVPQLHVDDDVSTCRPPATSCSYPTPEANGPWQIHLDAQTTGHTYPSNRFLVYHEIGHAVWELVLGPAGRKAFADDVRAALHGTACVNDQGGPCGPITEMFADEFARFAGGFAVSMSIYCTPPLLSRDALAALVGARADAKTSPRYLRRPVYDRGDIAWVLVRADAADVREDRGIRP